MAVFPYALRKVFIGAGPVRTTGSTSDLKPGELMLADGETFKALAQGATYTSNRVVVLAQGSYHQKDVLALGHGGLKESLKAKIDGHFISDWRKVAPKKARNHVVTIGYDGVDTTKTMSVQKDETYKLRITVKGSPVSRFINHDIYHDFIVTTICPDPCTDNCDDPTPCPVVAEDFAKQINAHPFLSPFIKAEAIFLCDTPVTPVSVAQDLYCLDVCDTGDSNALAEVQRQFPTMDVNRVDRTGSISQYQVCIPEADGAPDDFTTANTRVIPNCATCPTGYTLVDKLYKVEVKRDDAGSAGNLTTLEGDYTGESAGLTERLSYEFGTSTYILYFPTLALAQTAVATPSGNDLVILGGTIESVCTIDDATDVSWTFCGDRYKTTRTLTLTLAKDCGGDDRLTDLETYYGADSSEVTVYLNDLSLVPGSLAIRTAGDCGDVYEVEQYNDECLIDPCSGYDVPSFKTIQGFEGAVWVEDEDASGVPGTGCICGVRLTSAYVETKFGECSWDPLDHYELEIPHIDVSEVNEKGDRCTTVWPVTELQTPAFASGTGEMVKRELIEYMRYRQEEFFNPQGSRMNETQDINSWLSAVDVNKFYTIYYLTYNTPYRNNHTNLYDNTQYEIMVAFPEEANTSAFESLIDGYVTSVGVQLKAL
jgi:hypothetical protein